MLHKLIAGISRPWQAAWAAVPSQCAVCRAWPAERLCGACLARFAVHRPRCRTCALILPAGVAQCGECIRHPNGLDGCLAAVDYAYPWDRLLTEFKFQSDPAWARTLAALLPQVPGVAAALSGADMVVPVPLATERLRERGFNQSALLARQLAPARVDARLLLRIRPTDVQSRLPRAQRLRNLRGAFALEPTQAPRLAGRHVVLVDDVMTTGATLQAAAQVLRAGGAQSVTGLVVARTG